MKQLVTGGAGFIGANYIYYLLDKYPSMEIVCLDSLTYAGNISTLHELIETNKIKFIKGDITDEKLVNNLFESENFDVVVHFAAESHVDRSIENSSIFLNTNIIGTQVLLDASRDNNIKRFHQVSTDEVYGDLPLNDKSALFTEQTYLKPSSPYSASKTAADLLALSYFRTYGLPVTVSRCSNNYGPYQFPEKLIPLMIINTLNNKELPVYGTGENVRDWLYVEDHCEAIDVIINKGNAGDIYNIGGNNEEININIVKIILKELGKDESLITYVKDRLGHDLRYAIDATKIKDELGWEPKRNFDEAIKNTINWYIENEDWWTKIVNGEYKNYYKEMYEGRD